MKKKIIDFIPEKVKHNIFCFFQKSEKAINKNNLLEKSIRKAETKLIEREVK